jgi:glutathione S-transferase
VKLFYSPTSPFVRKVLICAILRGIDGQIERVRSRPHESPPDLLAANPLSKVPCLITVDGVALFDSPVICEFLDSIGDAPPLFPRAGGPRWMALKLQAMADGILDAAILCRAEQGRAGQSGGADAARAAVIARQQAAVARGLDALERELPHRTATIGGVAVAAALGYLDFRFAHEPWRERHPQLAAWYAAVSTQPAFASTVPMDAP